MPFVNVGDISQSSDSLVAVATGEMFVVSVVLGPGLLHDGHPKTLVFAMRSHRGLAFKERKVVVDNDSVRQAHSEEVHAVDTIVAELVVNEELLNAAWFLSNGGGTGKEPAVAKRTLNNVSWHDALVSKESVGGVEGIPDSLPCDFGGDFREIQLIFSKFRPREGADIWGEIGVGVLLATVLEGPEVDDISLVTIGRGKAGVVGAFDLGEALSGSLRDMGCADADSDCGEAGCNEGIVHILCV